MSRNCADDKVILHVVINLHPLAHMEVNVLHVCAGCSWEHLKMVRESSASEKLLYVV